MTVNEAGLSHEYMNKMLQTYIAHVHGKTPVNMDLDLFEYLGVIHGWCLSKYEDFGVIE